MNKTSQFSENLNIENYQENLQLRRKSPSGVLIDRLTNLEKKFYALIAYTKWVKDLEENNLYLGKVDNKLATKTKLKSKAFSLLAGVVAIVIFTLSALEILGSVGFGKENLTQGNTIKLGLFLLALIGLVYFLKNKKNKRDDMVDELQTLAISCDTLEKRLKEYPSYHTRLVALQDSIGHILGSI